MAETANQTEHKERLVAEGWVRQTEQFREYPEDVVYRKVGPGDMMQEITVPPSKQFEDKWYLSRHFEDESGTEWQHAADWERDSLDDILAAAAAHHPSGAI